MHNSLMIHFLFVTAVKLASSLIVIFPRFIPKPKASFSHFMAEIEPLQGAKDGSTHLVLFCVVSQPSQPRNQG